MTSKAHSTPSGAPMLMNWLDAQDQKTTPKTPMQTKTTHPETAAAITATAAAGTTTQPLLPQSSSRRSKLPTFSIGVGGFSKRAATALPEFLHKLLPKFLSGGRNNEKKKRRAAAPEPLPHLTAPHDARDEVLLMMESTKGDRRFVSPRNAGAGSWPLGNGSGTNATKKRVCNTKVHTGDYDGQHHSAESPQNFYVVYPGGHLTHGKAVPASMPGRFAGTAVADGAFLWEAGSETDSVDESVYGERKTGSRNQMLVPELRVTSPGNTSSFPLPMRGEVDFGSGGIVGGSILSRSTTITHSNCSDGHPSNTPSISHHPSSADGDGTVAGEIVLTRDGADYLKCFKCSEGDRITAYEHRRGHYDKGTNSMRVQRRVSVKKGGLEVTLEPEHYETLSNSLSGAPIQRVRSKQSTASSYSVLSPRSGYWGGVESLDQYYYTAAAQPQHGHGSYFGDPTAAETGSNFGNKLSRSTLKGVPLSSKRLGTGLVFPRHGSKASTGATAPAPAEQDTTPRSMRSVRSVMRGSSKNTSSAEEPSKTNRYSAKTSSAQELFRRGGEHDRGTTTQQIDDNVEHQKRGSKAIANSACASSSSSATTSAALTVPTAAMGSTKKSKSQRLGNSQGIRGFGDGFKARNLQRSNDRSSTGETKKHHLGMVLVIDDSMEVIGSPTPTGSCSSVIESLEDPLYDHPHRSSRASSTTARRKSLQGTDDSPSLCPSESEPETPTAAPTEEAARRTIIAYAEEGKIAGSAAVYELPGKSSEVGGQIRCPERTAVYEPIDAGIFVPGFPPCPCPYD